MTTATCPQPTVSPLEAAAIRLGRTLIAWGQRRAQHRNADAPAELYRIAYADRVRTAAAVTRQQLLP